MSFTSDERFGAELTFVENGSNILKTYFDEINMNSQMVAAGWVTQGQQSPLDDMIEAAFFTLLGSNKAKRKAQMVK